MAEVGYQDKWQRTVLAVCLLGTDKRYLTSAADKIQALCEQTRDTEILDFSRQWL
ncbi:DUF503 family protein [Thalassomonas viridans]|uniref:DUF503 family protein n=1 Tax=Thalassomonas viridans TaxID=137584 RepID=A0AAF0CE03_9GAMM|nr:DUF503 family protein [Thalassomonas viridans]